MRTVWKEPITPNSFQGGIYPIDVKATEGAKPLCVRMQNGHPHLWFEADPDARPTTLTIYCVGTGFGSISPDLNLEWFDTLVEGFYVWHFYRTKQPR